MNTIRSRMLAWVIKVGACLSAALFASSAVADSTVTYSGYECLFAGVTGSQSGFGEGAAIGASYTRCPLTRIASDVAGDIGSVIVRVQDNSSTQAISCYVRSCDGEGATCSQTSLAFSGGANNPGFTGSTYMNMGSVAAYSNGYAYIHCTLPSDGTTSLVYSYRATD